MEIAKSASIFYYSRKRNEILFDEGKFETFSAWSQDFIFSFLDTITMSRVRDQAQGLGVQLDLLNTYIS
jgi:hypothetical protein